MLPISTGARDNVYIYTTEPNFYSFNKMGRNSIKTSTESTQSGMYLMWHTILTIIPNNSSKQHLLGILEPVQNEELGFRMLFHQRKSKFYPFTPSAC